MQSAQWERDKEVNSDNSNTVNIVRARKREKTGRDKKQKRYKKQLHSVLKSYLKMKLSDFQRLSYSYI